MSESNNPTDGAREGNLGALTDEAWLDDHLALLEQARAAGDAELVAELSAVTYDPEHKAEHLERLEAADAAHVVYAPVVTE